MGLVYHGADEGGDAKAQEGNATQAGEGEALAAAEMEAYEAAEPVFEEYCRGCHDPAEAEKDSKALVHLSMDDYPFGGHHVHELGKTIPRATGATDEGATMPKDDPGVLDERERQLIVTWADAYERARAAGAGHHAAPSGPDHGHDDGASHSDETHEHAH